MKNEILKKPQAPKGEVFRITQNGNKNTTKCKTIKQMSVTEIHSKMYKLYDV